MGVYDKSITDCVEYLLAMIETSTGGKAQSWERKVETEDELRDVAVIAEDDGTEKIHGWVITIEDDDIEEDNPTSETDPIFHREYTVVLYGFYGLNDEMQTGRVWQYEILEPLITTIDADPTLGGKASRTKPCNGRIRNQHAEFGNYIVHYCEIVVPVILRRARV